MDKDKTELQSPCHSLTLQSGAYARYAEGGSPILILHLCTLPLSIVVYLIDNIADKILCPANMTLFAIPGLQMETRKNEKEQ